MQRMSSHFSVAPLQSLKDLMAFEIADNQEQVKHYTDWSDEDKKRIAPILDSELHELEHCLTLTHTIDSLKGETAMRKVYPSVQQEKATDAITRLPNGTLVLTEAKYLLRYGGMGPFGGISSFRKRISSKFLEMDKTMLADGEVIAPLRVIVVTQEQLPFSISHIEALVSAEHPRGVYSEDGKVYDYVICSSKSLRAIVDHPIPNRSFTDDCHFFQL